MTTALRLVMVEDVDTDAELVAWHLKKSGLSCTIHRVQTEPAFICALSETKPDLILSDFSLPQFDGLRALEIAAERAPDIPFLFVSGTIGEERAINALRRGAIDYILKSNLARLGAAVERALRVASLRAARRQSELQLRNCERQLRATVETSQDWIWEIDVAGKFRFCNSAVVNMLGYEPEALIGKDFRSYLYEDEGHNAAALLPAAGKSQIKGVVARWRDVDGDLRWLERNAVAILDDSGAAIGFRGTDRDITSRRDQDLGFCTIEMIFDSAGKPQDYRFLEINPAFEKQTGMYNAQGKTMRELAPGHEAHWFEIYGKVALTGEPLHFENEAKALDRYFDVRAYRVGGPESRKVGILFNDITDRKRAEAQAWAQLERLRLLNQITRAIGER
jgi:PAS domain S-box-containing protein